VSRIFLVNRMHSCDTSSLMPRIARIVVPGWAHHVTQRGNHREVVFFCDHDWEVYLELWSKYSRLANADLAGYSLMGNHVHLVPIPEFETSLAKAVGRTNNDFSRWQNVQCHRTGHLWQARFYSCPVALVSLWDVLAYVELNPVRAGLVQKPEDWRWSSARAHLSGRDETGLLNMRLWAEYFTPASWAEYLRQKEQDKELQHRIRTATQTGRPLAGHEAVRELELSLGRRLRFRG
jgi:putative transposase